MTRPQFEWDNGNIAKCQIHGMTLAEVEEVLSGNLRIAPDLNHSTTEVRLLAVGRTKGARAAFVVFTYRGDRIRPLSARFMHAKEAARYGS
jgi:uncharacterized DUF497 family protein